MLSLWINEHWKRFTNTEQFVRELLMKMNAMVEEEGEASMKAVKIGMPSGCACSTFMYIRWACCVSWASRQHDKPRFTRANHGHLDRVCTQKVDAADSAVLYR